MKMDRNGMMSDGGYARLDPKSVLMNQMLDNIAMAAPIRRGAIHEPGEVTEEAWFSVRAEGHFLLDDECLGQTRMMRRPFDNWWAEMPISSHMYRTDYGKRMRFEPVNRGSLREVSASWLMDNFEGVGVKSACSVGRDAERIAPIIVETNPGMPSDRDLRGVIPDWLRASDSSDELDQSCS